MRKKADFLEGYAITIANSKGLFGVANGAANSGHYGCALSLCVLASEEALKAMFLMIRGRRPEFEIDDFEQVYTNHRFKHDQIKFLFPLYQFFCMQSARIQEHLEGSLEASDATDVSPEQRHENRKEIGQFLAAIGLNTREEIRADEAMDAFKWWETANLQKNKGFYVDVNNDKWIAPQQITKKQFDLGNRYSRIIIHQVENCAAMMNHEKVNKLLAAFASGEDLDGP